MKKLMLLSLLFAGNFLYMKLVPMECQDACDRQLDSRLKAQTKLFRGISYSDHKLVKEALQEGANPNQLSYQKDDYCDLPPLALKDTLHPDIIKILLDHGANPNGLIHRYPPTVHARAAACGDYYYSLPEMQTRDVPIIGFFIHRFLKKATAIAWNSHSLCSWKIEENLEFLSKSAIMLCAVIETLIDGGAQINLQAAQDMIFNQYRRTSDWKKFLSLGVGIVYHMLGAYFDDYSSFIDCINKQDLAGVIHFGNSGFVNKNDQFGLLPLDYAMKIIIGKHKGRYKGDPILYLNTEFIQNSEIIQWLLEMGAEPKQSHIQAADPIIKQIFFRNKSECPVCLQSSTELARYLQSETPCCHNFICRGDLAILRARGDACPLCRKPLQ